jgi:hypothetical protein
MARIINEPGKGAVQTTFYQPVSIKMKTFKIKQYHKTSQNDIKQLKYSAGEKCRC